MVQYLCSNRSLIEKMRKKQQNEQFEEHNFFLSRLVNYDSIETLILSHHIELNTCEATSSSRSSAVVHTCERQTFQAVLARLGLQKAATECPEVSGDLVRGPVDVRVVQPVSDLIHLTNIFL